jgi:hypothetical protein
LDVTKCYKTLAGQYLGKYIKTQRCVKDSITGFQHIFSSESHGPCIPTSVFDNGVHEFMKEVPMYITEVSCQECKNSSCSVQGGRRRKTKHRKVRRRRTVRHSKRSV